jgi:hypothetical protein
MIERVQSIEYENDVRGWWVGDVVGACAAVGGECCPGSEVSKDETTEIEELPALFFINYRS